MGTDDEDTLAVVDTLCRQAVDAVLPIRFRLAASDGDRVASYRLRYEVVMDEGWSRPEAFPDRLERDAFDDEAAHVQGWHGDRLVATSRLVFPRPGKPLPTEEAFDLTIEPSGLAVDVSRMIVAREVAGPAHRLFGALLARSWLEVRSRGHTVACGAFTASMIRLIQLLGFTVHTLGPPKEYWGAERRAILVDVSESAPELVERASKLVSRWTEE